MVSIIVPVYNTKIKYLDRCISSLIRQSDPDIEILLIDDGSKEDAAVFCDRYSGQDERIAVYHKKNGGVSSARNLGIEKARGEYIAFVDSDDWVDPEFIALLVRAIECSEADIAIVDIAYEYGEEEEKTGAGCGVQMMELAPQELWTQLLHSSRIGGFLWNKLFKKALILQSLDERLYYSEDFVFTAEYAENIQKAVFVDKKAYHYRQGQGNASSDLTYNDRIFSLLLSYSRLEALYRRNAPGEFLAVKRNRLKIALNLRARYKLNKVSNEEQYAQIKTIIHNDMKKVLFSDQIGSLSKINILLTWLFPVLSFKIKSRLLRRKIS